MSIKSWLYTFRLPNGDVWSVPVEVIARHRADYYKSEFLNDIEASLSFDTRPLFIEDDSEIGDWAANNMDWEDVKAHAKLIRRAPDYGDAEFQEAWVNGEKEIIKP